MTDPTWTHTPQTPFRNAAVLDETGEAIAAIARELDASEANQIAALMAAAPRLLVACQKMMAANSTVEIRTALRAAEDAIAAAEVSDG
jgi:predicted ATPase